VNRSGNPEDADKAIREIRELTAKAGEVLDLMAARPNIISASLPEVIDYLKAHPEAARCIRG
jgi:hypothetical protein